MNKCIYHPDRDIFVYHPLFVSIWCKECYDKMDEKYQQAYKVASDNWLCSPTMDVPMEGRKMSEYDSGHRYKIREPNEKNSITFMADKDNWIMRIDKTENGPLIRFNTEDYPNCMPDDFALAVVKILCSVGAIKSFLQESLSDE
jgi:hypothetical protein